ncbi:LysM peptidoglycan-binding domain-containing protein [Hymenobacter sp. RP-2-7]|uniref:LysM peptidoglycan-binding domain-containing protein n=1 Tax=Hymenobacter polaris TaxID=2682546 RepID=A0A7Y0FLM8_9BACT|nr:LysM peptidoglycan-binding domain-containing protein [Hymenobacter polaris]NML64559.1 LysM peptidoglycan-binding domain-containing protein [Hymenobacter polaris]
MKHLLPVLLLGLATRPVWAATPPTVPAALDALGLHLTLDEDARQLVQAKVNSLCRHQPSLDERVARAEAAFPIIDQVLAQEGLPGDFRYLVLQESALVGDAESNHGAVGYWQLKRETALGLGLAVNSQVDERRHLAASTRAAARYLTRNNADLRNWADALLSYNLGPTGALAYVAPGDAGADEMNFTAHTNPYLLDFVAQKLVFEPATAAGTVPFTPWREVPATPGQTLAQHAAALGADPAAVAQLNTWLLASTVPDDGRPYTILVPLGAAPLASAPVPAPAELPTEVPGPPVRELPAGRPVVAAAPVVVPAAPAPRPVPVVVRPAAPPVPARPTAPVAVASPALYLVAPHETLYSLARRQGVRPAVLAAWNHLPANASLQAGQLLRLSPPTAPPAPSAGQYVVATGDTFYNIARRYRCTVADLLAHNDRPAPTLRVGETIRVPLY